jgi:large subunit ribosomal protein L13
MKTHVTTPKDIKRTWHLVDAKDQVLGRLSTQIAQKLIGKDKVYFTPALDCGDYVVVVNSDAIAVTGRKMANKTYYRHSNYPGGLKSITLEKQMDKDSRKIIEWAVSSMLPKNKLRDPRLRRLKVFKGAEHNYQDKFVKGKGKDGDQK